MFFHGLARFPISDNQRYIFFLGILVNTVIKTTVFLTNPTGNRTDTLNKFVLFAQLEYELYLIVMDVWLQWYEKIAYLPFADTSI